MHTEVLLMGNIQALQEVQGELEVLPRLQENIDFFFFFGLNYKIYCSLL